MCPFADDFLAVEEDEGEEGIGANPDEDYDYAQLAAAMDGSDNDSASDSDSDDSAESDDEEQDAEGARKTRGMVEGGVHKGLGLSTGRFGLRGPIILLFVLRAKT